MCACNSKAVEFTVIFQLRVSKSAMEKIDSLFQLHRLFSRFVSVSCCPFIFFPSLIDFLTSERFPCLRKCNQLLWMSTIWQCNSIKRCICPFPPIFNEYQTQRAIFFVCSSHLQLHTICENKQTVFEQ